jgi:hypothetical protein
MHIFSRQNQFGEHKNIQLLKMAKEFMLIHGARNRQQTSYIISNLNIFNMAWLEACSGSQQ